MSKIQLFPESGSQESCSFGVFSAVLLLAAITGFTACGNVLESATSTGNTAPRITLAPGSASVESGGTQQFTALVENTSNTGVAWSASLGKISSTGLFSAPSVTKSQSVVVVATSLVNSSSSAKVTATVVPAHTPDPLQIVTSSLVSGTSGISYSATLAAKGGVTPYQWTLASGTLPSGLLLSGSTGVISGVPSQSGSFTFSVTVNDTAANTTTQGLTLAVSSNNPTSSYDGPAELPRVHLQTTMADTPAPGKTIPVRAGGDFQGALDSANCGDTITLQAGATFGGVFYFPQKSCDSGHWIIIRTSALDSSLPPEGTRITPCYAGVGSLAGRPPFDCAATQNVMAKLIFIQKAGYGPVVFESGANHYRLVGLEITRTAGTSSISNLISPDNKAAVDHIVFDRLWVHGTAQDETTRGIYLSGVTSVAVIDSFFTDFHCISVTGACIDAQAIAGGGGDIATGPFKIEDNFLEASGENIIFGGSASTIVPTDIEIRRNHFFKPLIWMPGQPGFVGGTNGNPFIVKNLFELKNAQRVLFEANILEYSWGGIGQYGYAIEITPKNQASLTQNVCPVCRVTDLTIRYSTISHVGGVFVIANAASSAGGIPAAGERYSIHDVIADDIDDITYSGRGTFAQVSSVPQPDLKNLKIDHITAFEPNHIFNLGADATQKMVNFTFTNSIVNAGPYPFTTTGGGKSNCASLDPSPLAMVTNCFAPYLFSNNAIIASPASFPPAKWPAHNLFPPNAAAVQFVNYNNGNGGDYQLRPSSPYKSAGTDGRDLGADVTGVMAAIAGVP